MTFHGLKRKFKAPAAVLREAERPAAQLFQPVFGSLSFVGRYNTLHLFSFLHINNREVDDSEVVVSVTADVGMTLYIDGRHFINHHSRQKCSPPFTGRRAAPPLLPLGPEKIHLFHWKLYNCSAPMGACLMFGNLHNDHLDGFDFTMEIKDKEQTNA